MKSIYYSIPIDEKLNLILNKIFNHFINQQELSLENEEWNFLSKNIDEIPLVRTENSLTQIEFNNYLDKILYQIKPKVKNNCCETSIRYGYHNLDIVDNPESAALLFNI